MPTDSARTRSLDRVCVAGWFQLPAVACRHQIIGRTTQTQRLGVLEHGAVAVHDHDDSLYASGQQGVNATAWLGQQTAEEVELL